MSRKSLHCKSLVLGYYPILPEMFWSSGFLIFRRKNRWKIIFDGSYGKLFSRSFSFYFSADFSIHNFLNNSWGNFVYKRNQGVECHGNHRTQLYQMLCPSVHKFLNKGIVLTPSQKRTRNVSEEWQSFLKTVLAIGIFSKKLGSNSSGYLMWVSLEWEGWGWEWSDHFLLYLITQ